MSFYNKKEVVKVLHEAASLYKENLEDQKVLFLYGHPSQIKKELNCEEKLLSSMHHYETVFFFTFLMKDYARNFVFIDKRYFLLENKTNTICKKTMYQNHSTHNA